MQQLHEKITDMNSRYYDLHGKIVKAERRITTLTERREMWEQYNQYKSIHKQLAKVKPEKREQFEPVSYTHLGNEKKLLPRIGSLIESPGFYPNLTGTENLRIFATLRGVPNNQMACIVFSRNEKPTFHNDTEK